MNEILEWALDVLHLDDDENNELVLSLLEAIPFYIEETTGFPSDDVYSDALCKACAGHLLTLWFYADHSDDLKLNRSIDSLLKVISLRANRDEKPRADSVL